MHDGATSFAGSFMPRVEQLRSVRRVLLTTRVRLPVDHYVSAWLWGGEPRLWPFNRTFAWWAPRNLQSNLFLLGDFKGWMDGVKRAALYDHFGQAEFEDLQKMLSRFDLVWPLDEYQAGLRALAQLLEFPAVVTNRSLKSRPIAPTSGDLKGAPRNHTYHEERLCGAEGCAGLVAERAPFDAQLYAWVKGCFKEGAWQCKGAEPLKPCWWPRGRCKNRARRT